LRKLGVDDEKVTFLRRSLADFYWNVVSTRYRADVMNYFQQVRHHRRVLHFLICPVVAAMLAMTTLLIAMVLVSGRFSLWFIFCGALVTVVVLYTIIVNV
jgi:hypothetical protein